MMFFRHPATAVLILLFMLSACASRPGIIRQLFPVEEKGLTTVTNRLLVNDSSVTVDGVTVLLHFIDRSELFDLAKHNKAQGPSSGAVDPVVTTFFMEICNDRKQRIKIGLDDIVLLDGRGNQLPQLGLDDFKEMYPSSFERTAAYFFLFDRFINDAGDKKSATGKKTLFQGGYVFGNAKVQGLLAFDRLSEIASDITLVIPDVIYYDEQDKPGMKRDFKFRFVQSIRRLEE